jgi:hypothetical protein
LKRNKSAGQYQSIANPGNPTDGYSRRRRKYVFTFPAASALSGLLWLPGEKAIGAGESLKMRVSEDGEGLHLTVPKQAAELLKGFRPLLEALLKMSGRYDK